MKFFPKEKYYNMILFELNINTPELFKFFK